MPTYEYRCGACGTRADAFRRIADRDNAPGCHGPMARILTPPMIAAFNAYRAVAVDKESGERPVIRTRGEHEAFLKRNGYEEVGNDKSMAPRHFEQVAEERKVKLKEKAEALAQPQYQFNEDTHEATL